MKKILLIAFTVFHIHFLSAQCNGRYLDEIFNTVNMTTVQYSSVYNLSMDIYTPTGDNETNRPVILFAHGGSFIGGSRTETTLVELCERFAKRGYVAASMSYRLGGGADMLFESSAYPVVMKAISDGKAAVRFLKANAATYGIDSTKVIVGGNSAGGILMAHLAWIDDTTEVGNNAIIKNAIIANGGIEGNSGNPGPTSKVIALVDWAGAIKDTSWIDADDVPTVSLHGDPDGTVPYNCGQVLGGVSQVSVCGPGVYVPRLNNLGIVNVHRRFPNGDHQPWGSSGSGANFELSDSITTKFLYDLLCPAQSSTGALLSDARVSLFPNPATDIIQIKSNETLQSVKVYNLEGREVLSQEVNNTHVTISASELNNGVYTVFLQMQDGIVVKKLIMN